MKTLKEVTLQLENWYLPGEIRYFVSHTIQLEGKLMEHIFAVVSWYKFVQYSSLSSPNELWSSEVVSPGPSTFIPIQRIYCRYVIIDKSNYRLKIIPLERRLFI